MIASLMPALFFLVKGLPLLDFRSDLHWQLVKTKMDPFQNFGRLLSPPFFFSLFLRTSFSINTHM